MAQLTYELTAEDFQAGVRACGRRTAVSRWIRRIGYAALIVVCAITLLMIAFGPGTGSLAHMAPLYALIVMWVLILWVWPAVWAKRQFRGTPAAHGPIAMEFSETGIRWRSQHGESNVDWGAFVRYVEEPTIFALFTSPANLVIVPKRAFAQDEISRFREVLKEHIAS